MMEEKTFVQPNPKETKNATDDTKNNREEEKKIQPNHTAIVNANESENMEEEKVVPPNPKETKNAGHIKDKEEC